MGAFVGASVLLSCGGAAPPPAQPAAPLAIAAPAPPAPPAPDLSPVAEPANIVGLLRIKGLDGVVAKISQWTGIPGLSAKGLLRQFTDFGKEADLVATGAAIDAIVVLDPQKTDIDAEPLWAVSVGVTSLDDAVHAAEGRGSVTPSAGGTYRFSPGGKKRRHHQEFACALAPAAGDAPARLVCSDSERSVDTLLPYMTRTLPNQDLGPAEAHVEMRIAELVNRYGSQMTRGLRMGAALVPSGLKLDQPVFDGALSEASGAVAEELILLLGDLDRVSLDLRIGNDDLDAQGVATFRDRRSWVAGTAADLAHRTGPTPGTFWKLPAQANSAGFSFSADPKRFVEIRRVAAALLDGWLAHEGLGGGDRAAVVDLLNPKYSLDGASVFAGDSAGPEKAASTGSGDASGPVEKIATSIGSRLWGVDGTAAAKDGRAPAMAWVKAFVAAAGRPKVQDLLRRELAKNRIAWTSLKPEAAPRGLPAGTFAAVATLATATTLPGEKPSPATKRPKTTPTMIHVLAVPEPGQTWMAVGPDQGALLRGLQSVHAALQPGAAETGTLAAKTGLDPLRQGKFASGGFATLSSYTDSAAAVAAMSAAFRGFSPAMMPHRGQTPMLFTSTMTEDAAPRFAIDFRVPKDVIDDILALTVGAMGAHP